MGGALTGADAALSALRMFTRWLLPRGYSVVTPPFPESEHPAQRSVSS